MIWADENTQWIQEVPLYLQKVTITLLLLLLLFLKTMMEIELLW